MTREQSAQKADGYLEVLDVNIAIERELARDEHLRLGGFGVELHQDERVQSIDRRHLKRVSVPIVRRLAQRPQRVVSPCITLVVIPGVQKFGPHAFRDLSSMRFLA